ncbi:MAG: hypothetical protein WC455_29830 [Dehalococcoidia bacterium]
MMRYGATCRYFEKISPTAYRAYASNKVELKEIMQRDGNAWCPECQAAVEPEGHLSASGIDNLCPWCGRRL